MSRPVQTHVAYGAILVVTKQPSDPSKVGRLDFVGSAKYTPTDHVHNLLHLDTDFNITFWNDGQLGDDDDLLTQDRVVICFGTLHWDDGLQALALKAQFVLPCVLIFRIRSLRWLLC